MCQPAPFLGVVPPACLNLSPQSTPTPRALSPRHLPRKACQALQSGTRFIHPVQSLGHQTKSPFTAGGARMAEIRPQLLVSEKPVDSLTHLSVRPVGSC